jgi:hypothetical protein
MHCHEDNGTGLESEKLTDHFWVLGRIRRRQKTTHHVASSVVSALW